MNKTTADPSLRSGPTLRSGRGGGVHTVPSGAKKGWLNVINVRVGSAYARKKDAVEEGRRLAQKLKVEHTIHRKDGVIGEKNSYGNDPVPPRDAR